MDIYERPRAIQAPLVEHAAAVGVLPEGSIVSAEQAESAFGRTTATELDQDMLEVVDEAMISTMRDVRNASV